MPLLGDWVANITKKIGVKPCIPCQARQEKMNQLHLNAIQQLKKVKSIGQSGPSDSAQ